MNLPWERDPHFSLPLERHPLHHRPFLESLFRGASVSARGVPSRHLRHSQRQLLHRLLRAGKWLEKIKNSNLKKYSVGASPVSLRADSPLETNAEWAILQCDEDREEEGELNEQNENDSRAWRELLTHWRILVLSIAWVYTPNGTCFHRLWKSGNVHPAMFRSGRWTSDDKRGTELTLLRDGNLFDLVDEDRDDWVEEKREAL